jgi:hypothetical protein
MKSNYLPGDLAQEDYLNRNLLLRKEVEIAQIFEIFTCVALNLLPYLAADYPENDKSQYYKLYCKWNLVRQRVTQSMLETFCRSDSVIDS